jgi:hypothetical protein
LARGRRGGRREEGLGLGREAVMRRWEVDTEGGAMADALVGVGESRRRSWSVGMRYRGRGRE